MRKTLKALCKSPVSARLLADLRKGCRVSTAMRKYNLSLYIVSSFAKIKRVNMHPSTRTKLSEKLEALCKSPVSARLLADLRKGCRVITMTRKYNLSPGIVNSFAKTKGVNIRLSTRGKLPPRPLNPLAQSILSQIRTGTRDGENAKRHSVSRQYVQQVKERAIFLGLLPAGWGKRKR